MVNDSKNYYPKDSAGRLMNNQVPTALSTATIGEAEKDLRERIKDLESINYIYVLDEAGVLKGAVSIKEFFRPDKDRRLGQIMDKNLVTARLYTDQERVAYLALKNNIKSVPIVDHEGRFLGAVLNDDIVNIVFSESQEDISHLAGVNEGNLSKLGNPLLLPLWASLRHRLPWLILGLVGGLAAAGVISFFENTLAENILLAAFIPLIVYMASAVSTQLGYFIVRDLAIHHKINFRPYVWRQFRIIVLMGAIISALVFGAVVLIYQELLVAAVLAAAMWLAVISSVFTGIFIPYLFSRLKFDPADASGPIGTIIQDLLTVVIYLLVASIWL